MNFKRLASFILAGVITFTSLPFNTVTAYASGYDQITEESTAKAEETDVSECDMEPESVAKTDETDVSECDTEQESVAETETTDIELSVESGEEADVQAVPSVWYEFYNYELDPANHKLILTSSKGLYEDALQTKVTIPAHTTIDGETYTTLIDNSEHDDNSGHRLSFWYNDLTTIRSLSFEEGVELDYDC